MTQKELAKKAQIDTSHLNKIEKGIRMPSYKVLFRLANVLIAEELFLAAGRVIPSEFIEKYPNHGEYYNASNKIMVFEEQVSVTERLSCSFNIAQNLASGLSEAESKAWDALGRYKFQMFGYWAAIWVYLNRIGGFNKPNPWKDLVMTAREKRVSIEEF